ncbi:MAG: alpha/beta hydrolase [Candidatus Eisenbacteria bacterium]
MPSMLTWDVDTAYETAGEGEPIVFIHGSTLDMRAWTPQWRVFGRAARVIRYDLRGHGESSSPKTPYSAENYDLQLRTLLDALRISRATLVGHSFGASIALQFALQRPTRVSALVLANPSVWGAPIPEGSLYAGREHPRFDPGVVYDPRDAKEALKSWLDFGVFEATKRNETAYYTVESIVLSHKGGPWGENARVALPDIYERLGEIRVPTLIISGEEEDPYYRETARGAGERIAGARVVTFSGSGHATPLEKGADFNRRVLDFLEPLGITRPVPPGGEEPPKPRKRIRREEEETPAVDETPAPAPERREEPAPARAEEPRREAGDRDREDPRRRGGRDRGRGRRDEGESRGGGERPRRDDREGRGGGDRPRRDDRDSRGGGDRPRRDDRDGRGGGDRPRRDDREGRGGGERPRRDDRDGRGGGDRPRRDDRDGRGGGERKRRDDREGRGGGERPRRDDRDGRGGQGGGDRQRQDGQAGRGSGNRQRRDDRGGRGGGDRQRRSRSRDDRPAEGRPPQGKRPEPPKKPPAPEPDQKKKGWRDWFGFGKKKKDED